MENDKGSPFPPSDDDRPAEPTPYFPPTQESWARTEDPWSPAETSAPASYPDQGTPAGSWPPAAQPSVPSSAQPAYPWPPLPAAYPEPRRRFGGYGAIAAIAVSAALVGGAVGGTIAYNAAEDSVSVSALGAPANPVREASSKPANAIEAVADKVLPSVVSIDIRNAGGNQLGLGSGSGVVISSDGLILTNNHVVGEGDLAVTFASGRTVRANLVKADPQTDLAVIKAVGVSDATPISFGSSENLRVGQDVVAIGAPLGLAGTVTTGIVSALNRPVVPQQNADESLVIDGIQTDAPINPGNSGGALVDLNGNLVGITSAIASLGGAFGGQSGSIGLGFAIPIDQARVIAEQLARGETVAHALLGVNVQSSQDPVRRGALIDAVTPNGAAAAAGLQKGDIVTRLDDRVIDTHNALVAGVRSLPPGQKVTLTFVRGGEERTTDATLGSDRD